MKKGTIFDLKEFAVYDGPGLRQTVFLKGCPLRCNWCHNPKGLRVEPQLMVSPPSCTGCGKCKEVCKHETCIACGECVAVCSMHLRCIAGQVMTSQELADLILENSGYYAQYGGGVTSSSGEPLLQAEFLLEVLSLLPGVHKAIETSGFTDGETFRRVVEQLDYVIMDIKLFDEKLHRKYTGVSNSPILANTKQLCAGHKPFVIRIPVIPGVNDNEENYRRTAEWIAGAKMLEQVELMPYHKTAGAKYTMVGEEYRPLFDTDQKVQILQNIFREYGIRSSVL